MTNRIIPSENQDQVAIIDWIKIQHPWLMGHTIHIANQRRCSKYMGNLLRSMGLLKGASDLFIAWPTSKYYGLFIEVKSENGKPTLEQTEFLKRMNMVGYYATLGYGCEECIWIIKNYLANKL